MLVMVCEGVRWAVFEAGKVGETQVVKDGQVEGVVLMQWNVLLLLCCLL